MWVSYWYTSVCFLQLWDTKCCHGIVRSFSLLDATTFSWGGLKTAAALCLDMAASAICSSKNRSCCSCNDWSMASTVPHPWRPSYMCSSGRSKKKWKIPKHYSSKIPLVWYDHCTQHVCWNACMKHGKEPDGGWLLYFPLWRFKRVILKYVKCKLFVDVTLNMKVRIVWTLRDFKMYSVALARALY